MMGLCVISYRGYPFCGLQSFVEYCIMSANERTIPSTLPPPEMEVDSSELETGKLESMRGNPAIKQKENRGKSGWKGRIAGGSFLKHLHDTDSETENGPI
jgi:hypothetical protein